MPIINTGFREKYAHESYSNSYDHGFWEDKDNRNKDEMVMLIINELSECQEAIRSNRIGIYDFDTYNENTNGPFDIWYKENVKGCIGEELADCIIRIFDFVTGWGLGHHDCVSTFSSKGNFSADLLQLVKIVISDSESNLWHHSIHAIIEFANTWNIKLESHIVYKQRYNRSRPYKHGKLF